MFLIDFINLYTITFLVAVFLVAYLLKSMLAGEVLTPEGVAEELYPLIRDEVRFAKHFKSFLKAKRIEGTGIVTGPPFQEGDVVILTLLSAGKTGNSPRVRTYPFEMKILFLRVTAPTEVRIDDVVGFKGFLVGAEILGRIVRLVIDISELTYVGSSDGRVSDIKNGENGENRITLDY